MHIARREAERQRDGTTAVVIGAAIEVHRHLGPGLLESLYEEALVFELRARGLRVARQVPVPVQYKGRTLTGHYRLDLVAADRIVIEIKAVEKVLGLHRAQLLSYLRSGSFPTGLLLNFNVSRMIDGVWRMDLAAFPSATLHLCANPIATP